jgi:hypothetical protein
MEQAWLLKLPYGILRRLVGMNAHIDTILFGELFWKNKLRSLPNITSYRRYFIMHYKEYGRLWKGSRRFTNLDNVTNIYAYYPNNWYAIADNNLYQIKNDGNTTPVIKGAKKLYQLKNFQVYLDMGDVLRVVPGSNFMDSSIDYQAVAYNARDIIEIDDKWIILYIDGNMKWQGTILLSNIIQIAQYRDKFCVALDKNGECYSWIGNPVGGIKKISYLSKIISLTAIGSKQPMFIDSSNRLIDYSGNILPYPNIRKVIDIDNQTVYIGYDGRAIIDTHPIVPVKGSLTTIHRGFIDIVSIVDRSPLVLAEAVDR